MPIKQTQSYQSSNNTVHATLEDAQREEIGLLFDTNPNKEEIADAVFAARGAIMEILTIKTRKKRAPKAQVASVSKA